MQAGKGVLMAALAAWLAVVVMGADTRPAATGAAPAGLDAAQRKAVLASLDKGIAYLEKQQKPNGSWSNSTYPAITALAARVFLDYPEGRYTRTSPAVASALKFIVSVAKDNGKEGLHEKTLENYNTSICLSTLVAAKDPAYDALIANARQYLSAKMIWDETTQGVTKEDLRYGGAGYGVKDGQKRPDLSNTQWMVEALSDSGLAATDPAYERVVVFVKRCQNVKDKDSAPIASDDGGFYYAPSPPESKAGRDEKGSLKSYGGMTYAGFKSFLHAKMSKDDPRVRAAWNWIRSHYTVETNPGLGKPGLFYYYLTMAKALTVYGEPFVIDDKGVKHDWRADLGQKIAALQAADGSWNNENDRWEEGDPVLVTAYALSAMEYCLKPVK